MNERQELVNKLNEIKTKCGDHGSLYPACMGCIADFIMARERDKLKDELESLTHSSVDNHDVGLIANFIIERIDRTLPRTKNMTETDKIKLLKDVEYLYLQATVERSHNYTGAVLASCRTLILESLER